MFDLGLPALAEKIRAINMPVSWAALHINTPTTDAAIKLASAPPAIASIPRRDRSTRRFGAIVLIPPT